MFRFILMSSFFYFFTLTMVKAEELPVVDFITFEVIDEEGASDILLEAVLSEPAEHTIRVPLAKAGSVNGSDFELSDWSFEFEAGTNYATLSLDFILDDKLEGEEDLVLVMEEGDDYILGQASHMIATIQDLATALPTVNFVETVFTLHEGDTIDLVIELSHAFNEKASFKFKRSGSSSRRDVELEKKVIFEPGQTTAIVPLHVAQDGKDEGDEGLVLSMRSLKNLIEGEENLIHILIPAHP